MKDTTGELGLTYQYFPVPFNKARFLVDSSWANAPGHKSQMGVLVLVIDCLCSLHGVGEDLVRS